MKTRIFPRIYYSVCCSAFLLSVVVLLGTTFVLAHTPDTNTIDAAAAAQSQAGGQRVQLEGELEIVHQDYKDGHGQFVYSLKTADGTRVPLRFVRRPPTHLLTGDHVRANGQLSGGSLILNSGSTNLTKTTTNSNGKTPPPPPPPSIPVPNTFGSQSVLVILVNFQDDAIQPFTNADVQNAVFTTAADYIAENSYGQTSLTGDVVGWYTIPDSVTTCNMSQIATDAQNASAAAGTNLSNYTRYVYVFPYNSVCGWAGSSYVGGNPSQSWINDNNLDIHVIDHELGHAFGLWHSHLLDCGTNATIGSSCPVVEYGDLLDVMGTVQTASPHYNAFQKERLGWLNYGVSPSIQTVQTTGTYTINPYEVGGPGPNALKILKSTDPTTGAKTWYYLEARKAIGFDAFLASSTYYTQNETTGVLFHIGTDGEGNSSDLLDMTPASPTPSGWFDPSLVVGQSFQDSTAGVTITPASVSSTGATVQITMNGSACTEADPSVSVSPSQSQSVTAGTLVNFAVSVKDNDSSSCSPATFNLGDALPSGWSAGWNTGALSLSPGKSGSATLTVTSPLGTPDGSYNVGVNATNASATTYSGSTTVADVISTAPLSVSLTTNQSSYLPGQTVTFKVTMLYGTSPDVGASVTVTVTPPSARSTTLSGTTGSNGVASLTYKLSRHAAAGTYQVQLVTTVTGAGSVAASTSFTVQ
jgi:Gametolysin peptidase M11/NPCBM-associated, NEW3 domain of alpha-galactosidase